MKTFRDIVEKVHFDPCFDPFFAPYLENQIFPGHAVFAKRNTPLTSIIM